jgi:hypothetical protein
LKLLFAPRPQDGIDFEVDLALLPQNREADLHLSLGAEPDT